MKVNLYDMVVDNDRIPYLKGSGRVSAGKRRIYTKPNQIAKLLRKCFKADQLLEEYIWLICFDTTMQCVGIFEISHGSCNQSILHIPQVLQRTLLSGASVIVLGHNHPSGIVIPSNEDIQMTRRLWIASNILDITLLDHIIVSGANKKEYCSLREIKAEIFEIREGNNRIKVSAKYSCGFPNFQASDIMVVDRYLDYFTTIMEDRLWQVLAKPVFRWRNRSGLSMNAARAA